MKDWKWYHWAGFAFALSVIIMNTYYSTGGFA
ncbi:MAG: hypothetical protein [Caudoviricetes sp.]|nr:MAG: hypothetical protein [Caudoviricetes sp.]